MSRDDTSILDILRAAHLILEFTDSMSREAFTSDLKTQSAVLHQLLVIGEAVKRLSFEYRAGHPDLPWKRMAGMRDNLIHAYDGIDMKEVWTTITRDIPDLIQRLKPLVSGEVQK